ncbi:uncharacterized protein LOC118645713 isoform X2 [Monomorium pharaonis]|uniref:uncharacterized protein LOC118645713 isoform X2 n=1 Tax=Monomorium pharaonis TaxID=307658 RepID=UPI0017464EF8|nr:uncharacterized protein LOC118645713 isoform X2 [Monomorium pharaonis]
MSKREKRGPYKKYLIDNNIPISIATLRYRRLAEEKKKKEMDHESQTSSDFEYSNTSQDVESCSDIEILNYNIDGTDDECMEYIVDSETDKTIDDSVNSIDGDEIFYNENNFNDSENEIEIEEKRHLTLYDGCDIFNKGSELLIIAYALRHNSTDKALEDQLKLIETVIFLTANIDLNITF